MLHRVGDLTDVLVGTDLTQALDDVAKNARKSGAC
jgi:hypothetical protein